MKLGVYARGLSGMGGVKQYIESMCHALVRALPSTDELTIFHNCKAPLFFGAAPHVHEVLLGSDGNLACDFYHGPKAAAKLDLDVIWYTKYVVPFGIRAKTVTTVHDMAYYMPDLKAYPLGDTLYMRTLIRNSCRRADAVVAVSTNTQKDIHDILGVPDEKVHVIPEAADERYRTLDAAEEIAAFRQKMGLPERFILFTGGLSPRKNLVRLIDAYAFIAHRIPHALVLTGGKGWRNRDITDRIEKTPNVIRLGFVPDEDMPLLYNAAELFVYPSLYEGFGLPVLEAARCGTPVICASGSSLTEVGGDGVRFIDPSSTDEIAAAILELIENRDLRDRLIAAGYKNANRYSWDDSANKLLQLAHDLS